MKRLLTLTLGSLGAALMLLFMSSQASAYYDQNNLIDDSKFLNTGTKNVTPNPSLPHNQRGT